MNALLATIRGERQFRQAFRADANAPGALAVENAANNFIIDQFNHDHITAAEAVAAYNNGWVYGAEIKRVGGGGNRQVSLDGGAH